MFDEPKPGTIEDIFASTAPAAPTAPITEAPKEGEDLGVPPQEAPFSPPPILEAGTSKGRRRILVLAVVLIVALAAGGAWAYMKFYKIDNAQVPDNEEASSAAQPSAATPSATVAQPSQTPPYETPPAQTPPSASQDADHDGLSDQEEASLGTSSTNVDTDFDGLFDYEEVKTFKTNPLRADTDGDGFSDGQEVKNGYNPLGEGKLNEIKP